LVSVSAFMIANSGNPNSLKMAGAISTPRWQSCPMPACAPERGRSYADRAPALRARQVERRGAGEQPAALAPAKLRRVTRAKFVGD
jgi:hypothetical protein